MSVLRKGDEYEKHERCLQKPSETARIMENVFFTASLSPTIIGELEASKGNGGTRREFETLCHRRLGIVKIYMCSKTRQINAKRKKLLLL